MDLQYVAFVSSALAFSAVLAVGVARFLVFCGSAICLQFCIILIATSDVYPVIRRSKKEKYFVDSRTGKEELFPSIGDEPTVNLSVIVPAYNEEVRCNTTQALKTRRVNRVLILVPPMLDECLEVLEKRAGDSEFTYEILVVSDGSTDKTVEVADKYSKKYGTEKVRVLALETNRGKGGAVRLVGKSVADAGPPLLFSYFKGNAER